MVGQKDRSLDLSRYMQYDEPFKETLTISSNSLCALLAVIKRSSDVDSKQACIKELYF